MTYISGNKAAKRPKIFATIYLHSTYLDRKASLGVSLISKKAPYSADSVRTLGMIRVPAVLVFPHTSIVQQTRSRRGAP